VADIGRIFAKRFEPGDEQLALQIAAHAYPGAEVELAKPIDDLRHGRPPHLPLPLPPATRLAPCSIPNLGC
jgi:hypothetical protein